MICVEDHTFAICENNKIYCWGKNDYGQLGLVDNINKSQPVEFSYGRKMGIFQRKKKQYVRMERN